MGSAVLDALGACARLAEDSDAIAGAAPRYVAAPGSAEEAAAVLRVAAAHDLAVVALGAGTKQDWGLPPRRLDLVIDTTRLIGVVEHAAGDLVAVVRAGTPLSSLNAKLAAAGQQLALDAPLAGATVGGTVAVNDSGPRRMLYGSVRDLLIGITVVRADGVVARSGGKVVKNVAGYDLGKLMTGSYGTLALIAECAFRLHPIPAARAYVTRRMAPASAGPALTAMRKSQVAPSAVEIDAPPDGDCEVLVHLEGTATGVDARAATTAKLLDGEVAPSPPPWWGERPWRSGDVGIKLGLPLSRVPAVLRAADGVAVRGSAGAGVLYAGLPGDSDPESVARLVAALRTAAEHAVVLTAPPAIRDQLDMWGPVKGLGLMRRVKEQFDPHARLAPGRFAGGI